MVLEALNVFFHPGASDDHRKAQFALAVNVAALSFVLCLILIYHTETAYFRFGPSDTLSVVSVKVNTVPRYAAVILVLLLLGVADVIVSEIGEPVLGFRIYNPFAGSAQEPIVQFSRLELQLMGNAMYLVSHLRYVFAVVATVTQVDLALWTVFFKEGASVFTVWYLLRDKKFMTLTEYRVAHPDRYLDMADVFLDVENRDSASCVVTEETEETEAPATSSPRHSIPATHISRNSRHSHHRTVAFKTDGANRPDHELGEEYVDDSPPPPVALPPPAIRQSPPSYLRRASTSTSLLSHVVVGRPPPPPPPLLHTPDRHGEGGNDRGGSRQPHHHWESPNGMYAAAMSWRGPHSKPML